MFLALVRAAVRREFVDAYRKVIVAQSAIMKEEIKGLLEFLVLHPKTQCTICELHSMEIQG